MSTQDLSVAPAVSASVQAPWRRGFWSLIATQFQGAFNDNALKQLVVLMIVGVGLSPAEEHRIAELVGALFSLPFILFSMAGGHLADRYSKRTITIGVKCFEMGIMLFAAAGLALHSRTMQLAAVFLMGVHSAFFGPSKYGLLPELLPERRLSWGNGILELGTFLAIILGIVAAGFMGQWLAGREGWAGMIMTGLAAAGLYVSLGITRVPAADPTRRFRPNFVGEVYRQVQGMRGDRPLRLATLGNMYFFFLAALLQLNVFFYGSQILKLGKIDISLLNVALAIGIGLGSVAAGYLSRGKIEYGLVPLGAAGMGLACFLLGVLAPDLHRALWLLAMLGFSAGFFIVPICALLQHRPAQANKGGFLAAANLLSFVGVFLASGVHYLLAESAALDARRVFLVGAAMTLAGAAYVLWLLPDALLRFLLWLLTLTIYRIRVDGRDNIPAKGGALFVSNHLSLIDALLLLASTDRFVRFIMFRGMYEKPLIKPFARILRVIPISSQLRPREMVGALREASESIRRGEVVCIFAEGQITRIGQLLPFRRGFERIMRDVDAPIIPVHLDGVWGSIFSFEHHRFYWKWPRRIPYPVTVSFGAPLPPTATPFEVRQAVQDLGCQAWAHRKTQLLPLHRAFVHTARRHPFRFAMGDDRAPRVSFGAALMKSLFLARRLHGHWQGQEKVGVLLPPSVGGALVNCAALLSGKVPVNLNYTVSEEILASCTRQCDLKTVVSSKAFLDKVKLKVPATLLVLEELAARPRTAEKLVALLMAWLVPSRWIDRALGAPRAMRLDDLATVIFSSGSTGDPKGVMLSHYNVASNVAQMDQTFGLGRQDRFLGILPFFHSFGFTGTLCLTTTLGVGVAYHPTPLDPAAVGRLVRHYAVTFLLTTPTFLQIYLRGCEPEEFGSLRLVMAGAEKLPERFASAFEEHFGIRPLEGYGCTECSPAVAVNTHDYRAAGFRQVGAKRGKIGHPLPGIAVRIVDPQTHQPLPVNTPGLLLVRGPNLMQGYLGRPDKTAEVLRDGWYVTGDIATMDEDGFLQITDRLSRFSKIGGEMVPHIRLEEKLQEASGLTELAFAVTAVADEKKGERLIVLHTLADDALKGVLEKLPQSGLPNLWIPKAGQFFRVPKLPYLGTGKLDLRGVREMAIARSSGATAVTTADQG